VIHYLITAKLFTQRNYIPDVKVFTEKEQGYFSSRSREGQSREKHLTEKISELY